VPFPTTEEGIRAVMAERDEYREGLERVWDGHNINALSTILFDHALVEIQCDHDAKTDRPICACSLIELGWYPTVGQARQAWVDHVVAVIRGKWSTSAILRRAEGLRDHLV
jgi:hypothetical protein